MVGLITADKTQNIESALMDDNLFVKAILSPTVQKGMEGFEFVFMILIQKMKSIRYYLF